LGDKKVVKLRHKIMATAFVIIILQYPAIITYSFSLFLCVPYADGFSYLKKDTSFKCWEDYHLSSGLFIAGSCITGWAILFPLIILWNLMEISKKLNEDRNLKLFGIFYIGLTDDYYYWEVLVLNMKKSLFVLCATVPFTTN
jgi:hypothetical protein